MDEDTENLTPEKYQKNQGEIISKEYSQMPKASITQFEAQCERLKAERLQNRD